MSNVALVLRLLPIKLCNGVLLAINECRTGMGIGLIRAANLPKIPTLLFSIECMRHSLDWNLYFLLSYITPDVCSLAKDPGPCFALFDRWYYDSREQVCKEFEYGGCAGNDNRFDTERQCLDRCQPVVTPPPSPHGELLSLFLYLLRKWRL